MTEKQLSMAKIQNKAKDSVDGNFFVDSSCIDCGTCYWVAPETFRRNRDHSIVYRQPSPENEAAYRALFSCPVDAIGAEKMESISKKVAAGFPHEIAEGVYHCGFHAENSFGATSYFIQREAGNILVDSPRFVKRLADRFEEMGGIDWHLLSHKDDVADTNKYWERFKGKRHIHRADQNQKSNSYEVLFKGEEDVQLADDLLMIPVPGHTKGSVCYLYKEKFLFTGDHLAFSRDLGHLYGFKTACWYSYPRLVESIEKLLNYDFEYVLPGHGAPFSGTKDEVRKSLELGITWLKYI